MVSNDDWPAPAPRAPHRAAQTYGDLTEDPWMSGEDKDKALADAALGNTAALLMQRGKPELAALLLDVDKLSIEYDPDPQEWDLMLDVTSEQHSRFTDEVVSEIRDACLEVCKRRSYRIHWLAVREVLPDVGPDWRNQIRDQLGGKRPTNHARRARRLPPRYVEDYLSFTNQGELTVYRALKQIQEKDLPREDTIGIYPLAGGRIPGRTWEPDVLVSYRGRAGVLEIDGPHHNTRRALDTTRDHLLRDAGVGFVDRIPVEALENPTELTATLRRFLRRLGEVK